MPASDTGTFLREDYRTFTTAPIFLTLRVCSTDGRVLL
jgi:hypothetical protein